MIERSYIRMGAQVVLEWPEHNERGQLLVVHQPEVVKSCIAIFVSYKIALIKSVGRYWNMSHTCNQ